MIAGRSKTLIHKQKGQSLVEFALILPLMVLFIIGIFELGRAFFAYIAITNAAREGVRMYTFMPDTTTYAKIIQTVSNEVGTTTVVDSSKISTVIDCGNNFTISVTSSNNSDLAKCPTEEPVRVTVSYDYYLILQLFFPDSITLRRSVEMMKP
jgi:Flp pilus assembly protein TadG